HTRSKRDWSSDVCSSDLGLLGEVVHGEGAYIHNLPAGNFSKEKYYDMWRLKENFRNGNLYPTHGLGPVAQVMNINRGAKMDYLRSEERRVGKEYRARWK